MKKILNSLLALVIGGCILACNKEENDPFETMNQVRVPAEWESHAATWMQWPGQYETLMRPAFSDIIEVIQAYEPVHLLTSTEFEKQEAEAYLAAQGVPAKNITWHIIPVDNAWMRDNGPIYVTDGSATRIQNWGFTGWDGTTGATYGHDNRVPEKLAELLGIKVDNHTNYVLEKGNLEVNGEGIALLNWDCQAQRNPGMTKAAHETILMNTLGLSKVIWAYGHDPKDLTTGHIDGIARFINSHTVAITDYGEYTETEATLATACQASGLEVVRYPGDPNWLVGNGFVVAMGEGSSYDKTLQSQLETLWPDHDIYVVDARAISNSGGGIHCVTNDQPRMN